MGQCGTQWRTAGNAEWPVWPQLRLLGDPDCINIRTTWSKVSDHFKHKEFTDYMAKWIGVVGPENNELLITEVAGNHTTTDSIKRVHSRLNLMGCSFQCCFYLRTFIQWENLMNLFLLCIIVKRKKLDNLNLSFYIIPKFNETILLHESTRRESEKLKTGEITLTINPGGHFPGAEQWSVTVLLR